MALLRERAALSSRRGKADWGAQGPRSIFLDGISHGVVDPYSASAKTTKSSSPAPSAPAHTLRINVIDTRNAKATATYIDVDGFLAGA